MIPNLHDLLAGRSFWLSRSNWHAEQKKGEWKSANLNGREMGGVDTIQIGKPTRCLHGQIDKLVLVTAPLELDLRLIGKKIDLPAALLQVINLVYGGSYSRWPHEVECRFSQNGRGQLISQFHTYNNGLGGISARKAKKLY